MFRARAPLRIGLAGGGTDVSPYCDDYGGAVLNITINRFAYATIIPRDDDRVSFIANDLDQKDDLPLAENYPTDKGLRLHRGLYNRVVKDYNGGQPIPLTLITSVDCPHGSGLGASSTLMVAMVAAFRKYLNLPLGEYDVAHLAYEVERIDVGMLGGRQDQYAATFGGINFIEFASNDRVIVNPLQLKPAVFHELEARMLLYFTGISRYSGEIIEHQVSAMGNKLERPLEALHQLKRDALEMKAALLRGEIESIGTILNRSWQSKKATASHVTSPHIDKIYEKALANGAIAGKISGAGGGGFMMLLIEPTRREKLIKALRGDDGEVYTAGFNQYGATSWRIGQR
jgi:D-glycero-alpha-D-manno-heptose-7-phosphate kinase